MKKLNVLIPVILILTLGIIQFFPIDKTNPSTDQSQDYLQIIQAPSELATLIKSACYDCHSHETNYPWYMDIQPISWWINGHIKHGREELNFSTWGSYSTSKAEHKLEECYELIEKGSMPLKSYTWTHEEAKLSKGQKAQLIAWFKGEL